VGARAAGDGYHGPCGIDAFAFRSPEDDSRTFRPLVEFNARFTAGTVALGHLARHVGTVRAALGLAPGQRCHFYIGRRSRERSLASHEGTVVLPLLVTGNSIAEAPVLVVARERTAVDEWLGLPQEPE